MNTLTRAPQRPSDRHIALSLSAGDKRQSAYFYAPFEVPEGTTRVDIAYSYPKSGDCVIDLGLADPDLAEFPSEHGLRGWSGGARAGCFVARDGATPGYRAGEIMPGVWQVILGLYRLPENAVPVTIDIWFSSEPRALVQPLPPARPARKQPGWYCGDLQCHTFHSDAAGSPQQLHATARHEGLDFLAVTDHNTVTQQQAYFDYAGSEDLVFLPAYEFTTEFGHANVFGTRNLFDFRAESDADIVEMVRRIRAAGALFSINHDKPVIPWQWTVPEIDCMEVWQTHWLAGNHISLARYQERLAAGARITAIGSSDFHQPAAEPENNPFTLGRPVTFLWLNELSETGILDALRAGRSFVSEAPDGPMLSIASGDAGLGGSVPAGPLVLDISATKAAGDTVHIWDASGKIAECAVNSDDWQTTLDLENPSGFVRAELVAVASHQPILDGLLAFLGDSGPGHSEWDDSVTHPIRRALTSPIYIE